MTLVGFSKGCVVLNQILHELTALRLTNNVDHLFNLASRIRTFVWLDAGHNNGSRTMIWPIENDLISTLEHYRIRTDIFVTPFQIDANNRHKQYHYDHYRRFSDLLVSKSMNNAFDVINRMIFADQPSSIDKHFELLNTF
jgi:hypothetical protein